MRNSIMLAAVVLISAMLMAKASYCDYDAPDDEFVVFDGRVAAVDVGGSTLTVKGADTIRFPVSGETKLVKDIYDIKLSDISDGDYVTVEYYKGPGGPSRVTKVTVAYKEGE